MSKPAAKDCDEMPSHPGAPKRAVSKHTTESNSFVIGQKGKKGKGKGKKSRKRVKK
jgi:hypothetical protein